jgi:uncharacterized phage-like protein YoqJ
MNDLVDQLAVEAGKKQSGASGERAPAALSATQREVGPEVPDGHLLLVAGHKPPELGGYGPNPIAETTRRKLQEIIQAKHSMHPDLLVVTGLSLGTEQLAAEAAIGAGIPFVAVLPYPDQDALWPSESKRYYQSLLSKAQQEILLQALPPKNKQAAGAALQRRANWLARHVHEAVVVGDEEHPFTGPLIRSLREHLGDTEVWTVLPE